MDSRAAQLALFAETADYSKFEMMLRSVGLWHTPLAVMPRELVSPELFWAAPIHELFEDSEVEVFNSRGGLTPLQTTKAHKSIGWL